ncbi:TraX family protein [Ammoniphilus sp. 3BR4]|uniref:TraX family protein n=1 Tax=Ammoniphilus sp. 3BR4 TaxID=3158265 RepID=UPI0034665FD1
MLQLIAMITMLTDHVGLLFFPDHELFRIIGRLAFPLYCWLLVQGYYHTKDLQKYMERLWWIALLSQIPYSLALKTVELNVVFTLLLGLVGLFVMEHLEKEALRPALLLGIFSASIFIPMDYGLYGIALIFIYRYADQQKILYHVFLNIFYLVSSGLGFYIQLFSIFGTALIPYRLYLPPISIHRGVYRSFYPVHLAVLYLLSLWILPS